MALGNIISFGVTAHFFIDAKTSADVKSSLNQLLIVQTYILGASYLFFLVFFREAPKFPPSEAALAPIESINLISGLKRIFADYNMVLLTITFVCFSGMTFSFANVLSGLFSPFGYGSYQVAISGFICLIGGFFGGVVSGVILDKT